MLENKNLIFIHLPKAGGNTLHKILEREYNELGNRIYTIHRTAQQDAFKDLPESKRHSIKLLKGHMHYGMHEYLQGESIYMTMLRDPVDRFISQFYYSMAVGNEDISLKIRDENITLEEYTKNQLAPWAVNAQTRHLSGIQDFEGACTQKMYEQALSNLEADNMLVGLLDRFDESLILYQKLLEWKLLPTYTKKNVNKQKESSSSIQTKELIREKNHFDVQLYEAAQKKMANMFHLSWKSEARKLHTVNKLNQIKHSIRNVF